MGKKLNLSHLSEEECEKILHVLQKDFEVRQAEKERIGVIQNEVKTEQNKAQVLAQKTQFNKNCCIRCYQVFGLIFNRRRQCYHCGYNVCKDCCDYHPDGRVYICHTCDKERDLAKQSCNWFYTSVGHKFRRFGSAKVVRSLYKTSSYCKLRHVITQGGLNNNRLIIITNKDNNNNKANKANTSDTELDRGYRGSGDVQSVSVTSRKRNVRPPLPEAFRRQSDHDEDDDDDNGDDDGDSDELSSHSPAASTRPQSTTTRSLGSHPVTRAGSLDTLNLLSTPSSTSSTSKRHKTRTADTSKPHRASDLGKSRTPDPGGARARWEDVGGSGGKVKKETKDDIYKHAFESARQAEESKFKAKFDVLLNDLHQTLDRQSPKGLTDNFASTSYGEVMLSFRGRVKDLLVGFTQRLQLAYESFDSADSPEDHGQSVRQDVSRLLEDLLGESLDLTSDEAVSDLSSLSDDSNNDRHAFEDQIAQAVVSKILDNHRREVHHSLHEERRSRHLSSSLLVPEALNDDDENEDEKTSPTSDNAKVKDTDISKDFEDLRNFVQTTQSRSWQLDENCPAEDSADGVVEECGVPGSREGSSLDTHSKDRNFPPLPDFSQFEQIDFNSGEVDPDLLQMNLAAIPEETEDQLEEEGEAADTHWRENWIFKGQAPSLSDLRDRKRFRGDNDQPQVVMVPQPDEDLAPRIGNKDVHQLSDFSDNEELTDDDNSFYPQTSEELARISRHQRSTPSPSLSSTSLIPSHMHPNEETHLAENSKQTHSSPHKVSAKVEDVGVGTEDELVGPAVEKTPHKELKLLEDLVPAEGDDPKFVLLPESVTIQEGEPVKVVCRVSGTQPVDVFWYREQQEVEELEEGADVEVQAEGDRHQVTLYNLARQQAGQYMCIALSEAGKAIKYFTVTVKDNKQELKKPEFLKELRDVEVLEGQSVKFRCKVKGYPQPRVNWYKDGKLLKSNRSCRIEKFGNRDYILTVDYATMDDDAEYMVVAKNVAGEVKSTAQVIVEPYAEGHPLLLKSRSQSMSTVYTDTESDRPSLSMMDDFMTQPPPLSADREEARYRSPEDRQMDSLVSRVGTTRDNMRQEAETMLDTADELTALSHHLEDVERHLDSLEGNNSSSSSVSNAYRGRATNRSNRFSSVDDETALAMIADEKAMGEATRNIRKLTSNALSVLRAAEEIIQSEKSLSDHSFAPSQQGVCSSPVPDLTADTNPRSVSLGSAMDHSSLMTQSDLNQSVSSGYGTMSMTSSALEDTCNDDTITESSLSQLDQDEFAMYLPSLDDPTSGPYREEVSMKVSSSKPSGASSSSSSSTLTDSSASSYSSAATVRPRKAASPMNTSARSDFSDLMERAESVPSASARAKDAGARSMGEQEESLRLNFGPKEINRTAYGRDYVVGSSSEEGEGSERKRWSVSLNPYVPTADVVNRQPSLEETEEQIYLTAGKTFHLEQRVKDLQARVDGDNHHRGSPPSNLSRLEDQVADTAARVVRNEKEISNIERAVHTLQFSPRSSRGSSSSASSTPRESIDSGVSSFIQDRLERPPPVQLVGHTQEGDVPESRTEFDADSGVELPSVNRLRAMFGSGSRGKEEECEGSFRRVHSITARSLTKNQLQQLKEAGNTTLPDFVRTKDSPAQSTATLCLQTADARPQEKHPGSTDQQPVVRKMSTPSLSEPAVYKDLDPSKVPVLIYPQVDKTSSSPVSSPRSPATGAESFEAVPPTEDTSLAAAASPYRPLSPTSPSAVAVSEGQALVPTPKIRSGCISARAAYWERRIMQGEATDLEVDEEFPEMVQGGDA